MSKSESYWISALSPVPVTSRQGIVFLLLLTDQSLSQSGSPPDMWVGGPRND